ncbi:MAG TPA: amino acid ABC transporter permease [Thalassobaculum sp.]
MSYNFNFAVIWRQFDVILEALGLGLLLAAISLVIGTVIGLACGYVYRTANKPLQALVWSYVEFIRNVPLLLLIFFFYFGLPEIGIRMFDKYETFVITLSIYAGAYLTEVFRAGLTSVPERYVEAAKAIGLRPWQTQVYVVLPLTFRIVLPSLSNNFISLFKDTSLAAAIAIPELTFTARQINANTFRVMEAWLTASLLYLAVCYLIAILLRQVEKRYSVVR